MGNEKQMKGYIKNMVEFNDSMNFGFTNCFTPVHDNCPSFLENFLSSHIVWGNKYEHIVTENKAWVGFVILD
jgi:hypothetical protein